MQDKQESKILQAEEEEGLFVKTIHTDLGQFGNRTDVLIVEDGTVRGVSLLECDNPSVEYHYDGQVDPSQLDLFNDFEG